MHLPRSLTFAIATIAAVSSAIVMREATVPVPQQAVKAERTLIEVLVATRAISAGERVLAADLGWRNWPEDAVPAGANIRNGGGQLADFARTFARYPIMAGEPVAETKLVRPGHGSHVAALIASGKRAVAVPIREESAVGGLVKPNDRVDVLWGNHSIRTAEHAEFPVQTLLRGVKVLAIGGSVNADTAQSGNKTATLELTQEQARIVAGARISGEISLALIPLADEIAIASASETAAIGTAGATPKLLKFGRRSAQPTARSLR
ncbi:MAG: Flp pilus assembly protein CpaB [Hyphomicrobiales bacterium]|nr:Flp pilus assembly protein CpaB [Hyphomicrobiales bacterium]